ncbi:hypothetical protein D9M72_586260 [compost metagenome]
MSAPTSAQMPKPAKAKIGAAITKPTAKVAASTAASHSNRKARWATACATSAIPWQRKTTLVVRTTGASSASRMASAIAGATNQTSPAIRRLRTSDKVKPTRR